MWEKSQIFDFTSQDSFLSPPLVTKPLVHTPTPVLKKQLRETNLIALKYTRAVTKHTSSSQHGVYLLRVCTNCLLCREQDPPPPLNETLNTGEPSSSPLALSIPKPPPLQTTSFTRTNCLKPLLAAPGGRSSAQRVVGSQQIPTDPNTALGSCVLALTCCVSPRRTALPLLAILLFLTWPGSFFNSATGFGIVRLKKTCKNSY